MSRPKKKKKKFKFVLIHTEQFPHPHWALEISEVIQELEDWLIQVFHLDAMSIKEAKLNVGLIKTYLEHDYIVLLGRSLGYKEKEKHMIVTEVLMSNKLEFPPKIDISDIVI